MSYYHMPELPLEPPEDNRRVCFTCAYCHELILEGDEYFDLRPLGLGVILCPDCIDEAHQSEAEWEGYVC